MQNQTRAGSRFDLTSLRLPDISINDTITFWKKYALLLPIAHQPTKPRILGFKAKTTSYRTKYPNHTTNLLATHLYSSSWASQVRKHYNGKSPTLAPLTKCKLTCKSSTQPYFRLTLNYSFKSEAGKPH